MSEGRSGGGIRLKPFVLACLVTVVFLVAAENLFAPSFQNCVTDNSASGGNQYHYNRADLLPIGNRTGKVITREIVCTGLFIDRHNGLFAAIAAFIIAWFTYTLKRSTDRLWKAGNDALQISERAYISIKFRCELNTDADQIRTKNGTVTWKDELEVTRFAAQPVWINNGTTPTKNMKIRMDWSLGDTAKVGTYRREAAAFFVAPKSQEATDVIEMPGLNSIVRGGRGDADGPIPLMLLWGTAAYDDVFDKPHFIEWCYRARPEATGERLQVGFIQWGDYNRTDEVSD